MLVSSTGSQDKSVGTIYFYVYEELKVTRAIPLDSEHIQDPKEKLTINSFDKNEPLTSQKRGESVNFRRAGFKYEYQEICTIRDI
jgi:hypothetical protein